MKMSFRRSYFHTSLAKARLAFFAREGGIR
jgi:hypothetical protein